MINNYDGNIWFYYLPMIMVSIFIVLLSILAIFKLKELFIDNDKRDKEISKDSISNFIWIVIFAFIIYFLTTLFSDFYGSYYRYKIINKYDSSSFGNLSSKEVLHYLTRNGSVNDSHKCKGVYWENNPIDQNTHDSVLIRVYENKNLLVCGSTIDKINSQKFYFYFVSNDKLFIELNESIASRFIVVENYAEKKQDYDNSAQSTIE